MTTMNVLQLPIHKEEMYDEDNMKHLLNDDRFAKEDRRFLSKYAKHRLSGSVLNVSYIFGAGCEEHQIGRLYPKEGLGLSTKRFDLRNPLTAKWYWDTDIENCHWVIAVKYCIDNELPHKEILHYVTHRDECLKMVNSDRWTAKNQFIKILYLGDVKLHSDERDDIAFDIPAKAADYLLKLQQEVTGMADHIWANNVPLYSLKVGKEKIPIIKKKNPAATLMSLIFQTKERNMLLAWDAFLTKNNRYMGLFIHDGGLVKKLDGETSFPVELLNQGNQHLCEIFNNPYIRITQKEIKYDWKPKKPDTSQYAVMKREFEEYNCQIGSKIFDHEEEGHEHLHSVYEAEIVYAHKLVCIEDKQGNSKEVSFVSQWLKDKTKRSYKRKDFIPNIEACPKWVYNMFTGFNAERYAPSQPMDAELKANMMKIAIEPILKQIRYLSGGHEDYFCTWMAQIIQYPEKRSGIMLVMRDIDGVLRKGGRLGKTMFWDWFGNEILGEKYYYSVSDNMEIYGQFNGQFAYKLLINIEEANPVDNHANADKLKAIQTQKKRNVNAKHEKVVSVNDYARYTCCSNNRNCVKPNARNVIVDCDTLMKGDYDYFESFDLTISKPEVKWFFYEYLKTLTVPNSMEQQAPITSAHIEVTQLNAPLIDKWILFGLQKGTLQSGYTNDLYKSFTSWSQEYRESHKSESLTSFGLKLKEDELTTKSTNYGKMFHDWNIPNIVAGFKRQLLLPIDFEYQETINQGVCHINNGEYAEENECEEEEIEFSERK